MNKNILNALLERSDGRCEIIFNNGFRCNSNYAVSPHHILFKSRGGKDEMSNLVMACQKCHGEIHRGSKEKHQWIIRYKKSRFGGSI